MLEFDLSRIRGKAEGVSLWNLSVKLSGIAGSCSFVQKGLARIRLRACEILKEFITTQELDRYMLRTAKAFIDSEEYSQAESCLGTINIEKNFDNELRFNFFF